MDGVDGRGPRPEIRPHRHRATLTTHGDGWRLWLERPDAEPGWFYLVDRDEVGGAAGEALLSYFERTLMAVGYSATRSDGPKPDDWVATWTLAPGLN